VTEALATREKRSPDELIAEGRVQATALMKVVKEAGLSKDLGGSKPHLEVEAWQTIGRFNGFLTDIIWTRPVVEGGAKVGYEARAELVRIDDGTHVIGAEACCFFDEEIERKDGTTYKRWDDDYAVRSMAQTRAQSKLGRMAFAWVAVLAGYSGTPAEEMEGVRKKKAEPVVFPFGKHKDKKPSALELKDLHSELAFWQKKMAEETNPRYKANNEKLVAAINEAIAEKTAKVESPAGVASETATPSPSDATPGGATAGPPAGDVSFGHDVSPEGAKEIRLPTVESWRDLYEAVKIKAEFTNLEMKLAEIWDKYANEEKVAMKMFRDRKKSELAASNQAQLV
jgi:hypothetical protein